MTQLYGDAIHAGDTSREARISIEPHVQRLEQLVLEALAVNGPMTSDACEAWLDLSHQTISARYCALRQKGLIVDAGYTRKTRSGRSARVFKLP